MRHSAPARLYGLCGGRLTPAADARKVRAMSLDQGIADIQVRIAKAASDRDHWRAFGRQERYLEAYLLVDTLKLELDRMRQQGLESTARSERYGHPRDAAVASPGPIPISIRWTCLF